MRIVIDITEQYYNLLKSFDDEKCSMDMLLIKHGTPLPKGHGDLKDVSKIYLNKFVNYKNYLLHPLHSEDFKRGYNSAIDDVYNVLCEAPTIIEADKEGTEG